VESLARIMKVEREMISFEGNSLEVGLGTPTFGAALRARLRLAHNRRHLAHNRFASALSSEKQELLRDDPFMQIG
jgi:hypothetical protein